MKTTTLAILLAMSLSEPVLARANKGVEVLLELRPASTLPGLPVNLVVTVRNNLPGRFTLPRTMVLRVVPAEKEVFFAKAGNPAAPLIVSGFPSEYGETIAVTGQSTAVFVLPVGGTLDGPDFFADPRVTWPGSYRLQLVFGDRLTDRIAEIESGRIDRGRTVLFSSEAVLDVVEPGGADKLVWQRMLDRTHGRGWGLLDWGSDYFFKSWRRHPSEGPNLASEIWFDHPQSGYRPYVALLVPADTDDERIRNSEIAIREYPSGPLAETYRLLIASSHAGMVQGEVDGSGDLRRALADASRAKLLLQQLKDSEEPFVAMRARQLLEDLPTPEQLAKYDAELRTAWEESGTARATVEAPPN